jgi:hypothetical protein
VRVVRLALCFSLFFEMAGSKRKWTTSNGVISVSRPHLSNTNEVNIHRAVAVQQAVSGRISSFSNRVLTAVSLPLDNAQRAIDLSLLDAVINPNEDDSLDDNQDEFDEDGPWGGTAHRHEF